MIQDHPDLDGRFMRWCEHLNTVEVDMLSTLGYGGFTNTANYSKVIICEDCGDKAPANAEQWLPKLIGTRIDNVR